MATTRFPCQTSMTFRPKLSAFASAIACSSSAHSMTVAGEVMWPASSVEYTRYGGSTPLARAYRDSAILFSTVPPIS